MSREPDLVSQLQVINSLGDSDHNMIEFTLHLARNVCNDTKELRNYKHGDYDSIQKCLSVMNWDTFLNGDTKTSWNKFKVLLLDLINIHVPKKVLSKLEIWSKAQRESARRPKSDWGKLEGGKIFQTSKSRGLNSNALAYAKRALLT